MRIVLFASALAFLVPAHAEPQLFDYRATRAPLPGTVWHYTKSARDGADAWHIDLYFASPTRIEVLKWVEGGVDFVEVHAEIDANQGMATTMSQWNTQHGRREPKLWLTQTAPNTLALTAGDQHFDLTAKRAPIHVWGFDMMAMAYLLPHLAKPDQAFSVSMIDPNKPGTDAPFLIDDAQFIPDGEELIDGVLARKYRIAGPVFGTAEGHLWVGKDSGRIERVEHVVPTSTDWPDFKLEFEKASKTNGVEWERFKLGLADQQGGGKGPGAAAKMKAAYDTGGVAAALAAAADVDGERAKAYEEDLNVFGYALLGFEKNADAIAVLAHAAKLFPKSVNAWDSLAEAQTAAGDVAGAKASYRKLLELDPKHEKARAAVGGKAGD